MLKTVAALSLLAALSAVTPLQAQEPVSTTATFGSWTVRCNAVANKEDPKAVPAKLCEMVQSIRIRKTGQVLMEIALGRLNETDPISMVFKVPATVWLRSAVPVSLGNKAKDKADFEASYFRCHPQYCLADNKLTNDQQENLLKAKSITVGFTDATQKTAHIPVSLEGFAPAFNSIFADKK
ncbi:MAG: hypothetical protein COB78_13385 [Hyphomicrobiales bacterium]|nr:MAG: hypothetical protein COB78_13385 [Hyphomicrobiales bacterium]